MASATGRQILYRLADDQLLKQRFETFQMDIKQSFDAFIQQVGLEEESAKKSWDLWESFSSKAAEFPKDALIPCFVCATYVTICSRRHTSLHAGDSFTICSLSKILKAAKVRMVEFFQKMKEFAEICNVENSVAENLNELKKTFCISSAIFFKFKRVVPVVLEDYQSFSKSETSKEAFFKTCWLLFLVCKGWQMHQVGDLMTAFYLLLCCVDYVHRRLVPSSQHPTDLQETNISVEEGILPYLCQESSVPYTLVNSVHAQYFQPFLDSEGCKRDLLNVDDLSTMYNEIYDNCGDVDERDFFDAGSYLWIPFSEEESIAACNLDGDSSSTFVHEPHVMTTTEVLESRVHLSMATHLRDVLEVSSDTPSQELLRFWNCCKRDPKTLIQSHLTDVQENFMKGFTEAVNEENSNISNQIFIQAKKLYYRVMEAMLLAEEKRLSCSDFSALLNSVSFHISLMACTLEVLMADKGLPSAAVKFPWILNVLELKAFDFFKVTESFILHEPHLGSKLIKHLNSIEEQVLESLAWKANSPLLTTMMAVAPHVGPASVRSGQQQKKSQPLNLFLRKVNQLAYKRLQSLCNELNIDDTLRNHMWTCLEQSLRLHWQLMRDRHLDQMILCAIYAISKVTGKEIQFKQIVISYKRLPFASLQVYISAPGKEQESIIGFYNNVYMVAMKSTILQFAPNKVPPVSPAPKSSLRIPGKKNFYLSPLRNSPSNTLTPKSRSLYSFGDSPGSGDRGSLSRINASMRAAVHSQTKVPQKRLRFDDYDIKEPCPGLANGHSTEKGLEARVNETKGEAREHETEEGNNS